MKNVTVCGALLLACSCAAPPGVTVEHFGVMREVMMEGKTEARVALADYEKPGFYGVGALAGLEGEVLIYSGLVLVARGRTSDVRSGAADRATLLTVAHVDSWREIALPDGDDLEGIGSAIAAALPESAHKDAAPVPFLVEGTFTRLALHVVRGACPHAATSPETEPDRWNSDASAAPSVVVAVGFYAPGRAGVMTHHGTSVHAHAAVLPDGDLLHPMSIRPGAPLSSRSATAAPSELLFMGHVDSLVCGPRTKLFVPAR